MALNSACLACRVVLSCTAAASPSKWYAQQQAALIPHRTALFCSTTGATLLHCHTVTLLPSTAPLPYCYTALLPYSFVISTSCIAPQYRRGQTECAGGDPDACGTWHWCLYTWCWCAWTVHVDLAHGSARGAALYTWPWCTHARGPCTRGPGARTHVGLVHVVHARTWALCTRP